MSDDVERLVKRLRRFIFPDWGMPKWATLAASYDSAKDVRDRKSIDMALYLRERRDPSGLRAFHRRQHLERNR